MKSVIRSIKPYWVFLIIARKMGWNIPQEKTVEVGKNFPRDPEWSRKTLIYCSKDKKSFNRIPEEYQPLMRPFLGKVIGEFTCDRIETVNAKCSDYGIDLFYHDCATEGCLTENEVDKYFNIPKDKDLRVMKGNGYAWHISNLKIYDKPKEIREFNGYCKYCGMTKECLREDGEFCEYSYEYITLIHHIKCEKVLTRPPQSWCYVEAAQ